MASDLKCLSYTITPGLVAMRELKAKIINLFIIGIKVKK